ncbi:MAG: HPr kinase/phosphorylase [Pseudomonadota bacterium]|jgi:HPr kinase/phosphorylase
MTQVHASCVALDGRGVLITGASGAGKSDLALRLIDGGALLVADDQVLLTREKGAIVARPPPRLAGLIEVRGLGIRTGLPTCDEATLALVVALVARSAVERLPPPAHFTLDGASVPRVKLCAFDASAPAKVRAALRTRAMDEGKDG